jgi:hypothetical protein
MLSKRKMGVRGLLEVLAVVKDVFLLYAILLNVVAPLSMWHHSPKGGWDSDIEHKIIIYI